MGKRAAVQNSQGVALMVALFLVLAVSLLGMTALHLATQEIASGRILRDDAAGLHVAEAGADLVLGWIHAPEEIPSEALRQVLLKRERTAGGGLSYFDAEGRSQFRGTAEHPDLGFDARRTEHDQLMNDPERGWFRQLGSMGRVIALKIYGPTRSDLLCTVEVTAVGSGTHDEAPRTVRVQLAAVPFPAVGSAVQAAALPVVGTSASPVWAHWGGMQIVGDAAVRAWSDVPAQSSMARVTGQAYGEMPDREDRWFEMKVGGALTELEPGGNRIGPPLHVTHHQFPVPGLPVERWDYARLKRMAQQYGSYFTVDAMGRLHGNGNETGGAGMTLDDVLRSAAVGMTRGLVFVDTLDQQAPRGDNLPRLTATVPYAEGVFVVNAHVTWRPIAEGLPVPVLSPPTNGVSLGTRVPVRLANVNLNGVLYTTGALSIEGPVRTFGAVLAEGALSATGAGLEVWFNHELRSGLYRGLPVVEVAAGTWRET